MSDSASGKNLPGPWTDYQGAHEHTTLSVQYLSELVMKNAIPFKKVGRRTLFSIPALDQWINERHAQQVAGQGG